MDELYHVWFSIKGRKPALEGEVGDRVKRLFTETAMRVGIRLLEAELVSDHAHLLVAVKPAQSLPSVMHRLKGATSRFIFLEFPDLRLDLGHNSFWQKGYGRRRIRPDQLPAVRIYIRSQRDRPLRREG